MKRRVSKPKAGRKSRYQPLTADPLRDDREAVAPRRRLNARQKAILIAAGLGFFAAGLILAELLLAAWGVGAESRYRDPFVGFEPGFTLYEKTTEPGGQAVYTTRNAKLNFFNNESFAADKPKNRFRIFVLGGSTVFGRPYDGKVAFSHWLERLLNASGTGKNYEVINAGGISYASYRIAVLMNELTSYEPDMFVVYTGHNEFLEERTYSDLIYEAPWMRALRKAGGLLRTVALLKRLAAGRTEASGPVEPGKRLAAEVNAKLDVWSGLAAFHRDARLQEGVIRHFGFNLDRMIDIAQDAGVPILFVNPIANLKDFSPFKSEFRPGLPDSSADRSAELLAQARDLLEAGQAEHARELLEEAAAIDDSYADIQYWLGRAYLAEGRFEPARAALLRAKDLDVCPLRMLETQADVLSRIASRRQVPFIDFRASVEADCRTRLGHSILGEEYLLDHVHPSIEMHQFLAEQLLAELRVLGYLEGPVSLTESQRQVLYQEDLATLDENYYARRDMNLAKVLGWAGKTDEALRAIARSSQTLDGDAGLHYQTGILLERQGKLVEAAAEYRRTLEIQPQFFEAQFNLGKVFQKSGDHATAIEAFSRAGELNPRSAENFFNLALSYREVDRPQDALLALNQSQALDSEFPGNLSLMGSIYLKLGDAIAAEKAFKQHLLKHASDAGGHYDLGLVYANRGDWEPALAHFAKAIQLDPRMAQAQRALGAVYKKLGREADAVQAYQRALELDDRDADTHFDLASLWQRQSKWDEALAEFARTVELNPSFAEAYANLGAVYGQKDMVKPAIEALRRAIELNPQLAGAHYNLAQMLLLDGDRKQAAVHMKEAMVLGVNPAPILLEKLRGYMDGAGR